VSADPILERLKTLHPKAIDMSLDRVVGLMKRLGDPQDALAPVVHVAGTNGKGSTLACLRAMLEAAGRRVHVYTSPHLVRFNERIRLETIRGTLGKLPRGGTADHEERSDKTESYKIARYAGQFVVDEQDFIDDSLLGVRRFNFTHPRLGTTVEARIVPGADGELVRIDNVTRDRYHAALTIEVMP
jgi:hypothetical protein